MPRITIDANICKGCELCINACPRNIISIDDDTINSKGYHPARLLSEERCTGCASCALMCPDIAITVER